MACSAVAGDESIKTTHFLVIEKDETTRPRCLSKPSQTKDRQIDYFIEKILKLGRKVKKSVVSLIDIRHTVELLSYYS
jgi:hypothetical protein